MKHKRILLFGVLPGLLSGFLLGLLFSMLLDINRPDSIPATHILNVATPTDPPMSERLLLLDALDVAAMVSVGDYRALADRVHPEKGLVFSPYSHVDLQKDLCFRSGDVRNFDTDRTAHIWGITDGEGAPIQLTPVQYFQSYVWDKDYLNAPRIGLNQVLKVGSTPDNVQEVFPDAEFVEFNYPGDPAIDFLDWSSLKVVFERVDGRRYVVALIHSKWTV